MIGLEMTTDDGSGRPDGQRGRPAEDGEQLARDLHDIIVHRMFAVGLDLHAALAHIENDTAYRLAAEKIRHAIDNLNQAIGDLRTAVVGHGGYDGYGITRGRGPRSRSFPPP
jgi:hypothetical protein